MVYCLCSPAAIISAEGKVGFGGFSFKQKGVRERERNALETIFILAEFSVLA